MKKVIEVKDGMNVNVSVDFGPDEVIRYQSFQIFPGARIVIERDESAEEGETQE